jgi:hypothetical protein
MSRGEDPDVVYEGFVVHKFDLQLLRWCGNQFLDRAKV